jgi:hypothetical protein
MMMAMARMSFVIIFGLRIAFIAVVTAILVRGGCRAGASLMGASLDWSGSGICHRIKPLIDHNLTTSDIRQQS